MEMQTIGKYYYDCVSNTLHMSPKFYENAGQYNSAEYTLLQTMRREIPNLQLHVQEKKKRKTSASVNLSIKAMKQYIALTRDKDRYETELTNVIAVNSGKKHPLNETRKWFNETFPHYDSVPRFDADGYLIVEPQNETAAEKGGDDE